MSTSQWIKKLGGHAGELYVAAELSKRGIPNSLLPENFSDDDILLGKKDGKLLGYVQVKSCHPDRANSFILKENDIGLLKRRKLGWLAKNTVHTELITGSVDFR
jgi:hypothetical protein